VYRGKSQFRSPTWLKVFLPASAILVPVLTIVEYRTEELSWIFFGLLILSVFMTVSVVAVFTERIELDENELKITHNFQRTVVPRANIEKATWAKGCGALLLLKDGGSIKLPEVGENSQGLCNSIRAWVKAT
jgi:hypothetical protein